MTLDEAIHEIDELYYAAQDAQINPYRYLEPAEKQLAEVKQMVTDCYQQLADERAHRGRCEADYVSIKQAISDLRPAIEDLACYVFNTTEQVRDGFEILERIDQALANTPTTPQQAPQAGVEAIRHLDAVLCAIERAQDVGCVEYTDAWDDSERLFYEPIQQAKDYLNNWIAAQPAPAQAKDGGVSA